ncbi:MAG: DMT family transporter [Gammaproteobacteria bacterium]|nr:DMT family transporter [Gammaproteobacteria bacterium]
MNNTQKGYLYALAAALIWSGFILISRLGGISELGSFDIIAIRYITCSAILLPIWWFKFRFNLFNPKLIVCSLVGGLAYALCTSQGFQLVAASHAAMLLPGLMPLFIIVLSYLINGERHSIEKWLGITVITLGILTLLWPMLNNPQDFSLGHLYLIGGAWCWAVFSVLIKRWGITPWHATVSLAVITCVIYLPFYVAFLPKNISMILLPDIVVQAFYQGFMATIVQMIFYVRAVQSIGPSSMGAMMAVVPLLSGVSAIFIFNEVASLALISGLILVSIGAWLAQKKWLKTSNSNINAI